jgi:hypothetical protein
MAKASWPWLLLTTFLPSAGFAACGGDAFDSDATPGGQAGEPTTPVAGSSAQAGGDAGGASTSGGSSANDAGSGAELGGAAGEPSTESCTAPAALADLSLLKFGEAEPLEVINDTADIENLRFARVPPRGPGLIYTRDFFGSHIWITDDAGKNEGAPVAAPLAVEGLFESNALLLQGPPGPALVGFNFFFQRTVSAQSMQLELLGGKMSNGSIGDVERLPAPFNAPAATVPWSYGIAIGKERVVWTVNTDGALGSGLRTATLEVNAEPAQLDLKLPNGCSIQELDFAPWLTPDGRTLLFRARQRDAECALMPGELTALFAVNLDAAGEPAADAVELTGLAGPNAAVGTTFTDGSLSPDSCWLYFSSLNAERPQLRLYRARRLTEP